MQAVSGDVAVLASARTRAGPSPEQGRTMENLTPTLDQLGVDPRGQHARAGGADGHDAVHPPARRADARRAPRPGRHGRLGHPDPRCDHPRRRGRGHRLRHDRRAHPVRHGRPARRPDAAAPGDRAGRPAQRRRREPYGQPRAHRAAARAAARRWRREAGFDPASYAQRWDLQLGTLGSGNHFIEVTADETGGVWLFLHSGSRGVGNRIAQKHIAVAREALRRRVSCRTATWPTSPRARRSSTPTSARCGGRRPTRCSTVRR